MMPSFKEFKDQLPSTDDHMHQQLHQVKCMSAEGSVVEMPGKAYDDFMRLSKQGERTVMMRFLMEMQVGGLVGRSID